MSMLLKTVLTIIGILFVAVVVLFAYTKKLNNIIDDLESTVALQSKTIIQNDAAYSDLLYQKADSVQNLAVKISDLNSDLDRLSVERDLIQAAYVAYRSRTDVMIDSLQFFVEGVVQDGEDDVGMYRAFSGDTSVGIVNVTFHGKVYMDVDLFNIIHGVSFRPFSLMSTIYMDDDGIVRHHARAPDGLTITLLSDIDAQSFERWFTRDLVVRDVVRTSGLRFVFTGGFLFGDVSSSLNGNDGGMRDRILSVADRLYIDPSVEIFHNRWSLGYTPVLRMAYVRYNFNIFTW